MKKSILILIIIALYCLPLELSSQGVPTALPYHPQVPVALDDWTQVQFRCPVNVEATEDIQKTFREFFKNAPTIDKWLAKFPSEVNRNQKLYEVLQASTSLDLLSDAKKGKAWLSDFPVELKKENVFLTSTQIEANRPSGEAKAANYGGEYQKFFVDQGSHTLYVSSASSGLSLFDVTDRIVAKALGKAPETLKDDFFIYNKDYAYAEVVKKGQNYDLSVLQITDRTNPYEVYRFYSALPNNEWGNGIFAARYSGADLPKDAPTFRSYMAIKGNQFQFVRVEPNNPQGIKCDEKGECFTFVLSKMKLNDKCVNYRPLVYRHHYYGYPDGPGAGGDKRKSLSSELSSSGVNIPPPTPTKSAIPNVSSSAGVRGSIEDASFGDMGGKGGAGALTQMMVYQSVLYVLSASGSEDTGYITAFDLSNPIQPTHSVLLTVNNHPETLTLVNNLLVVGGSKGLVNISLAKPLKPRIIGQYISPCPAPDPVDIQGTIAYRAYLRGPRCYPTLEVIDMSDLTAPKLITTIRNVSAPKGPKAMGNILYVADMQQGVLLYDISDGRNPKSIGTLPAAQAKDIVISNFDVFVLSNNQVNVFYVGDLYQKDATNLNKFVTDIKPYKILSN